MNGYSISLPAPRREEARFAALAVNAGFAGSFGSVYCSHVFANAQTGNIISLASEIHSGDWAGVWSRTAAVGLFILGIYLSIRLPYLWFGGDQRRWKRCCLLIETACFLLQGLLPFEQLSAISPAMYLWPVFGLLIVLAAGQAVTVMPWLLAFAAGAMLYVVVEELIPEARLGEHSNTGTLSVLTGFLVMMMLDVFLG